MKWNLESLGKHLHQIHPIGSFWTFFANACAHWFLWFSSFRANVQHPITFFSCFTIANQTNKQTSKWDAMRFEAIRRSLHPEQKNSNNKIYWKLIYFSLVLANKCTCTWEKYTSFSNELRVLCALCSSFLFISRMSNMLCDYYGCSITLTAIQNINTRWTICSPSFYYSMKANTWSSSTFAVAFHSIWIKYNV